MRKIFFVLGILFCVSVVKAETRISVDGVYYPKPIGARITEANYMSSTTCSASNLSNVWISSQPSHLYLVSVSSPGSKAASVAVYDASNSTDTARKIKNRIDASVNRDHFLNIGTSSGVSVSIQATDGGFPCVDVLYVPY